MAGKQVAKKAVKKTTTGKARRRKANAYVPRFQSYIARVLKSVHPDVTISKRGMAVIHSFVLDIMYRLAEEAARLCKMNKQHTLNSRDVQTASRLCLPGELAKHAVSEAQKALAKAKSP